MQYSLAWNTLGTNRSVLRPAAIGGSFVVAPVVDRRGFRVGLRLRFRRSRKNLRPGCTLGVDGGEAFEESSDCHGQ